MLDKAQEKKTRNLRLTKAVKNPALILEKGWHEDSAFCEGFFDRCENEAFVISPQALNLARRSVEIATANGDPHLVNRSHGVLSHAYLACPDRFWAGKTLEMYKEQAVCCCSRCRSEYLRREGEVLGEERKVAESLAALNGCLEEGEHLTDDARGRILFVRAITHYFAGDRDLALADAGRALELISLDSPRGYFLDTIACMVIFVGGGGARQDAVAAAHLERFQARIAGLDDWRSVRTRHSWAVGHLYARLGKIRGATSNLESAFRKLLKTGLTREVFACGLDSCQLRCRNPELREDNRRAAEWTLRQLLKKRPELRNDQRKDIGEMLYLLENHSVSAFAELGALRRSFIAPVPGQLGERIGPE